MTARTATRQKTGQKTGQAAVLGSVATSMRAMLNGVPGLRYVHRRVPALGLELVLERQTDERLRLAMARADREPSAEEKATLGDLFGTPEGCEWGGAVRRPVRGRSMLVCEVVWRER